METEPVKRAISQRLEAFLLGKDKTNNTDEKLQNTDGFTPPSQDCVHHWIIETPKGGSMSSGRCKCCGGERLFRNSGVTLSKEYTMEETGKRKLLYGSRDHRSIFDADNIVFD